MSRASGENLLRSHRSVHWPLRCALMHSEATNTVPAGAVTAIRPLLPLRPTNRISTRTPFASTTRVCPSAYHSTDWQTRPWAATSATSSATAFMRKPPRSDIKPDKQPDKLNFLLAQALTSIRTNKTNCAYYSDGSPCSGKRHIAGEEPKTHRRNYICGDGYA